MLRTWAASLMKLLSSPFESRASRPYLLYQDRGAVEQLSALDEGVFPSNGTYDYATPLEISAEPSEVALIQALSETLTFKRLADIRFLGALDYCLVERPNGTQSNVRFTRAQHSIGVAALSRYYLTLSGHNKDKKHLCIAAAMLHDIGHCPFSHTLEPVFKERFGLDHHKVSEDIIQGRTPHSAEVAEVLRSYGVDPSEVVDVLNGHDEAYQGYFSGPINFDTIEGILRSRNYLKMQNLGITPLRVVEAATLRRGDLEQEIVDAFWACKDEMYNLVIRSRLGVFFDTLFQEIARTELPNLQAEDFYLTESQIFRKYPEFRDATKRALWDRIAKLILPEEITYQSRHFYVCSEASFFDRDDSNRYRQSKKPNFLTLNDVLASLKKSWGQDDGRDKERD